MSKIKTLITRLNDEISISRLSNISYDAIQNERIEPKETQRNFTDAKYQYQYNFGGHTYKQVFEIAGIKVPFSTGTEITILYSRIKLEYLRHRNWQPAGEQRSISYSNFRGIAQHGNSTFYLGGVFLSQITQSTDYSYSIGSVIGSNLNTNAWTYFLEADAMNTHVPSHNQCLTTPPFNPCSGGSGLSAAPFWNKPY